jgi:Protein of unknown function (DUF1475)
VASFLGGMLFLSGTEWQLQRVRDARHQHLSKIYQVMIWFLRVAAIAVLITMLVVTTWASNYVALWNIPRAVATHPWFIATLFDTYFAFLAFWAWVAYKETSWAARGLWLLAILLLGNIAISIYVLRELFRVPADAKFEQVLLRRK